jgi:hypothetical protein
VEQAERRDVRDNRRHVDDLVDHRVEVRLVRQPPLAVLASFGVDVLGTRDLLGGKEWPVVSVVPRLSARLLAARWPSRPILPLRVRRPHDGQAVH